jgi:hypothetical protein
MGRYVYTEKDVIDAICDITEGSLSQYQASDKYGVPQPVLSKRLSSQKNRKESTHPHQRVSTTRRTTSFVGLCGRNLWATLSHIANFEAASKPSSVNRDITSHWVKTGLPGSSNVIRNYLPSLGNARKLSDFTGLLRRRSISTSISGRTSIAGSSLRIRLTWTRAA